MPLDSFFKDELSYLDHQLKIFADEYPQVSQFLSAKIHDPDVERTLEGFAFLTSTLYAKVENEFPQLTYGLIDMLWPNYLQPTPSMTIVEFTTKNKNSVELKKGAEIKSRPDQEDLFCTFRTARDFDIFPLSITQITIPNKLRNDKVKIDFTLHHGATFEDIDLNKLRFYLGDNKYTSHPLYLWLNNYLDSVKLIIGDMSIPQPMVQIQSVGFKQEDAILVYPQNTYMGYRLLQEYFCFPEGFLFVDIMGLEHPKKIQKPTHFSLEFTFSRPLPPTVKIRNNSFKINCTPAINLFSVDNEPILLDGSRIQYPLITNYQHPQHYEIFSIDHVNSWLTSPNSSQKNRTYSSFETFKHQMEHDKGNLPLYYKIERQQEKNSDAICYFLSFVRGDEVDSHSYEEVISVQLTCTNKNKAAKLKIGDICVATESIPAEISFKNITRPSITLRPSLDQSQHWTTVSTLSLNYLSLLNKKALTQILRNYNFSALYNKQSESTLLKIIDSIEVFETQPLQQYHEYLIINGLQSTLYIDQAAFNNEGELYLFGSILANFYSLFATVNSFHSLIVVNLTNQEKYEWPAKIS